MHLQNLITTALSTAFTITHLDVINESNRHNVPPNSETHFKIILASPEFEGLRKVTRHQRVYQALDEAIKQGVHALALHIYTDQEWQQESEGVNASPNCLGGSKQG